AVVRTPDLDLVEPQHAVARKGGPGPAAGDEHSDDDDGDDGEDAGRARTHRRTVPFGPRRRRGWGPRSARRWVGAPPGRRAVPEPIVIDPLLAPDEADAMVRLGHDFGDYG